MKSKLVSFAVALLASFCLWIYVVTVVNQEVSNQPINDIAVTFSGADQIREDSSLVITTGSDATVDLRVSCSRQTLRKLSASNISVVVDVSRIKNPGDYTMQPTVVLPTGVANSEVTTNVTPRTISFTVERFTSKSVPVRGVLSGSVAEGYYAPSLECTPNEIQIEGPESLVNEVSYAQVILEQEGLTETVTQSCPFTLIDANGDPVDATNIVASTDGVAVETIEVRQQVLQMKEVPLTVEFISGGGATGEDMIWNCDPNTITVAGEPEVLETINQITVAQFDLATLTDSVSEDLPITLPNELINVDELESVHVNISFNSNKLATKTLKVTNFTVSNRPEGTDTEVRTVQLTVTIRGPADQVEEITAEDLIAVIDGAELHEGTQSVPATIQVSGGGIVAAIGDYSVAVTVTRE